MANFTAGTSFTDGVTNDVTAAKLNALVADAVPTSNLALASTTGTISNFTASTANITLGTIPTLTAGTTTGTAGIFTSGTITTGLIPTLTVGTTTSTAGIFTSGTITTGVIPTLTTGTTTSTNEVVTNGTITNLSATTSTFLGTITGSTNVVNIGSGQIYKDSSGRVGIGTTSPDASYRMTVSGSRSGVAPGIIFTDSDATPTNYGLYINGNKSFTIYDATAGVNRFLIDSSGNVGIGTTSPTSVTNYKSLEIKGTTGGLAYFSNSDNSQIAYIGVTADSPFLFSKTNSALKLGTNDTERLRITSGGNLLVGTTSANPSGATTDGRVVIQATGGGASALVCYTSITTAYNVISIENGNGQVGRIQTNASATSYLTSSDYRLKENVIPLTDGLAKVALLKPCTFKWKIDGTDGQGFIAHELQEVCPYAVGGEKDAVNANGEIEPQGIDQSKIVPILTAALKEAIAKIETLESKVAALESA